MTNVPAAPAGRPSHLGGQSVGILGRHEGLHPELPAFGQELGHHPGREALDLVQDDEHGASETAPLRAGREPQVESTEHERPGEGGALRAEGRQREADQEGASPLYQRFGVDPPVRRGEELDQGRHEHDLRKSRRRRPEELGVPPKDWPELIEEPGRARPPRGQTGRVPGGRGR